MSKSGNLPCQVIDFSLPICVMVFNSERVYYRGEPARELLVDEPEVVEYEGDLCINSPVTYHTLTVQLRPDVQPATGFSNLLQEFWDSNVLPPTVRSGLYKVEVDFHSWLALAFVDVIECHYSVSGSPNRNGWLILSRMSFLMDNGIYMIDLKFVNIRAIYDAEFEMWKALPFYRVWCGPDRECSLFGCGSEAEVTFWCGCPKSVCDDCMVGMEQALEPFLPFKQTKWYERCPFCNK